MMILMIVIVVIVEYKKNMDKEKKIKIDITYSDNFENSGRSVLLDLLTEISEDILEKNLLYNRGLIKKWNSSPSVYEYRVYRKEKINNVWCHVYPSKLNFKKNK